MLQAGSTDTSGEDGFSDRTPALLSRGTAAPRAGEGVSVHPEPRSLPFFLQPVLGGSSEELAMVAMPQLPFLMGGRHCGEPLRVRDPLFCYPQPKPGHPACCCAPRGFTALLPPEERSDLL